MEKIPPETLVAILHGCGQAVPAPIYPSLFAQTTGMDRATLDQGLDQLRLGGLVCLTDWVPGQGQGYTLTPEGKDALNHPQLLTLIQLAQEHASVALGEKPAEHAPVWISLHHSAEKDEDDREERPTGTAWERGEAVRGSLLEIPPPVVTMTLVLLNVLAFIVGAILAVQRDISLEDYLSFNLQSKQVQQLRSDLGDLDPISVFGRNQWWRILTYCFVHGGFLHLFLNMYFLFSLGPRLESMWGRLRFLFLYLVSGISGGLAVLLVGSAAMGASGALCGLLASMVFWIRLNRDYLGEETSRLWLRSIILNIGLILFISLLPGISAAGHIGGGLAGLILAYPLTYQRFGTPSQRRLGLIGALAVPLAGLILYGLLDIVEGDNYRTLAVLDAFAKGEKLAVDAFQQQAVPLFKQSSQELRAEPEKSRQAQKTFTQADEEIQQYLAQARAIGPFHQPELREEIDQVLKYLANYADLLTGLDRSLQGPQPWTEEDKKKIEQQIQALGTEQRGLANLKLLKKYFRSAPEQ